MCHQPLLIALSPQGALLSDDAILTGQLLLSDYTTLTGQLRLAVRTMICITHPTCLVLIQA